MLPVEPMLLSTARGLPGAAAGWVLEPKFDGIRVVLARTARGRPLVMSRHGQGLTGRLPQLAEALERLPLDTVLDGELVAVAADTAVQDFAAAVSVAMRAPRPALQRRLSVVCFDLPRLAGGDLTGRTQLERSRLLTELLEGQPGPLRAIDQHEPTAGVHRAVVEAGWEGSVLKRTAASYRPGERSPAWRKLKARHTASVVLEHAPRDVAGRVERAIVRDALGRWPAIVWPSPIAQQLAGLGPGGAAGLAAQIAFSRRDANGAPREARLSLLARVDVSG